ncbi:PolC-type DNA polymerase III [Paracoccus jiaweipingae]|uniref:PolC-type DNA polymerase III n=1 Tax=Paracoccus sp. p2-l61 TaxID=3366950 RepID=UPI0037902E61
MAAAWHDRLSLRLRVFLIFAGLALGVLAVIGAGLYAAADRLASSGVAFLGQAAPGSVDALALAAVIGCFGALGLIVWVWYLFDHHVARPIETLAGGLRTGAAPAQGEGRYLADLAPAARDVCFPPANADSEQVAAVMADILADCGAGLVLRDAGGRVVLANAAARAAMPGLHLGDQPQGWPDGTRHRVLAEGGGLAIIPAPPVAEPRLDHRLEAAFCAPPDGLAGESFVVFDTETTGLDPENDRIVQIAGVRVEAGRLASAHFDMLVNPGRPIPPKSTAVHGVTDQMVQGAPDITHAMQAFRDFAGDAILVAHNAPFDMGFLRACRDETACHFDNRILDTVLLSAMVWGQSAPHSLDALLTRLGIELPPERRHTALGDAEATAQALLRLLPALRAKGLVHFQDVTAQARKHRRLLEDANTPTPEPARP